MNNEPKQQGRMDQDDPTPTSPDPLNPGRTEVDPMSEGDIEELPENEGERPLDEDDTGLEPDRVREETDHAIMDKPQHPQ
jgi:hypothetical protein